MSKKILFIEDEPHLQKALNQFLQKEGFETKSALNGEEGLEMALKEIPDLILLDLILPKKDGFEVLTELKANEKTKNIPVIVLTNLEGTADVEKALRLGATSYLIKANYGISDIIVKIKETIKD